MYEQVLNPKENKSKVIANSVTEKKNDMNQGFGFVDNRQESIAQRKCQENINNNPLANRVSQLKGISKPIKNQRTEVIQRSTEEALKYGALGVTIGAKAGIVGAVVGGAVGATYGYRKEIQEYFNGVWIQNGNNYVWQQGQPDPNLYVNTGRTRRDNFMVAHDVYESWGNTTQRWLNNTGLTAFANDPNQGFRAQQGQRFAFRWFNAMRIGNNHYSVGVNLHANGHLGSMWIIGVNNFDINPAVNPIRAGLQTRLRTLVTQGWAGNGNQPLQNPGLYASPQLKQTYPWIYPNVKL